MSSRDYDNFTFMKSATPNFGVIECTSFSPSKLQHSLSDDQLPRQPQKRKASNNSDYETLETINKQENSGWFVFVVEEEPNDIPKAVEHSPVKPETLIPNNRKLQISNDLSSNVFVNSFEQSRKKTIFEEKEAEEDCKLYKSGRWAKTKLMLTETRLAFFEFSLPIKDLQKIKISPWANSSRTKLENIIKISFSNKVQLFSVSTDRKCYGIPTSFHIFACLIEKKMAEGTRFFNLVGWEKEEHSRRRVTEDSYIYGNIYKKSQVLGNWENRFIVVKKNGIFSYKNSSDEQNHSFHISSESIKYLWTRFEKVDNFLIVKIKHGIFKTEFGIPIFELASRSPNNWLYSFYRIMPACELESKPQWAAE